jgi:hypothetical protein
MSIVRGPVKPRHCPVKHPVAFLALALLSGCQGAGVRVTDLGGGQYHLAIRSAYGPEKDRENAAAQAVEYCSKSGKTAKIDHFDDQGSFVVSPSTGVVFSCQ